MCNDYISWLSGESARLQVHVGANVSLLERYVCSWQILQQQIGAVGDQPIDAHFN